MKAGEQVITAGEVGIALEWQTPNAWGGSISCLTGIRGFRIDSWVTSRCLLCLGLIAREILCAFTGWHLPQRAKCWFGSQWLPGQAAVEFFIAVRRLRAIILHPLPRNRNMRFMRPFK